MIDLQGKRAVVTGAAGGMGLAIAEAFSDAGCKLVLVDVSADRLSAAVGRVEGAHGIAADLGDPAAARACCEEALGVLGGVDILVNNAGILSNNKVLQTTPEEWRRIMSVNLDGCFYMIQGCLPDMKARKWGRIVNVCSVGMKTGGITGGTAYVASKGGLAALTFSVARETAAFGVTVNGIAPAYVKTAMVTDQLNEEQRARLLTQIPVGRFCEPEEAAALVLFLASPAAGFITGEVVDINAGLHMD
ncbi:MAG: SDR family NAD(P)-dependent oxidoreductase [Kiloniellales bacterium]|nr:SDR family NAD(P)-dependent oxidoreductase [Kiloniellales bacterium]